MNEIDQYWKQGGFYEIPVEVVNDLIGEFEDLQKENQKLKEELLNYKQGKVSKKIYGEYKNVRLSEKEYNSLVAEYGEEFTTQLIIYLDEYIEMKGYKAKSHYLCIKKWVVDAVNQSKYKNGKLPEWFDKENKPKEENKIKLAPSKELEELNELLKEFD